MELDDLRQFKYLPEEDQLEDAAHEGMRLPVVAHCELAGTVEGVEVQGCRLRD